MMQYTDTILLFAWPVTSNVSKYIFLIDQVAAQPSKLP